MIFLSTDVGTKNPYLYNIVATRIHLKGQIVINVASSGITLLLFDGVRTTHFAFKIPLELMDVFLYYG